MSLVERRTVLRNGSLIGLGLLSSGVAAAASKVITPPETEGPFYPTKDQSDKDVDLTSVAGATRKAEGEVVIVRGQITDAQGNPLSGAVVDIWQACASGKYNHPQDPNDQPADPNFQYFARFLTDNNGNYRFRTIIPGAYPATAQWTRPPHIHFRIDAWGKKRLTTQMYFKGNELNGVDQILRDTERRYGRAAKDSLIVDFSELTDGGIKTGVFNIVIGTTPAAH